MQWGGGFADADVPTHVPRKGRAEVAGFFEAVVREQDFHRFEPILFSAAGGGVPMLAREDFTFRRSGRRVELEIVHHFTVSDDGRIVRYRSFHDPARYAAAYRGEPGRPLRPE